MTFGGPSDYRICLDPRKEDELIAAIEEVKRELAAVTAGLLSIRNDVFGCLTIRDVSFRQYVRRELIDFYQKDYSEQDLDFFFKSTLESDAFFLRNCFLQYQDQFLKNSDHITPVLYRKKMMEIILQKDSISIKGMRQALQLFLNPENSYVSVAQPDVQDRLFLEIFKELRAAFGKIDQ